MATSDGCFNGATTKESWKAADRASRLPGAIASMGPRRRSRGRPRSDGRFEPEPGFNGATTKESWKADHPARSAADHGGFNGATTKESWKARQADLAEQAAFALQWGHDEGVVEDRGTADRGLGSALQWGHDEGVVEGPIGPAASLSVNVDASMGPRRRSRGRPNQAGNNFKAILLQWGHDEGVVEGHAPLQPAARFRRLQWGHDEGVVEGSVCTGRPARLNAGFNGATTKESWKARSVFDVLDSFLSASMGPRRRSRGRRSRQEVTSADREHASMGPRRRSRGRLRAQNPGGGTGAVLQWGHDEGVVEGG